YMKINGIQTITEPIAVHLNFYFTPPKAYSKKRIRAIEAEEELFTKQIDLDDLIKSVTDSMNSIMYLNDSNVVGLTASKHYDNESHMIGICTFGKPASNSLCIGVCGREKSHKVYELNRLYIDENEKNLASFFVSRCLKYLKKYKMIIVSYSDTGMNHHGYVYQACNFIYTWVTKQR